VRLNGVLATLAASVLVASAVGAAAHADPITNGDFSLGNVDFTSDYHDIPANGTIFTGPPPNIGVYGITSNPSTGFLNGYDNYGDHTTGTGLMMFVDGYQTNLAFLTYSLSLPANTTYTFSYWVTGADSFNLPDIQVEVNGAPIDTGFQVTDYAGTGLTGTVDNADAGTPFGSSGTGWQKVTDHFTTAAAGPYDISLFDINPNWGAPGDDFTVDDLSLTTVGGAPEPATWAMMLVGVGVAGGALRMARSKQTALAA
jgi:PEP-CTERM motif